MKPANIVRLHRLIWVLIYGGLLSAIAGGFAVDTAPVTGRSLLWGGCLLAAAGFVLIWVRSRIRVDPPPPSGPAP